MYPSTPPPFSLVREATTLYTITSSKQIIFLFLINQVFLKYFCTFVTSKQNSPISLLIIRPKQSNNFQRTYFRYENDERSIPIEILLKLADYHKTSVDYLLVKFSKGGKI